MISGGWCVCVCVRGGGVNRHARLFSKFHSSQLVSLSVFPCGVFPSSVLSCDLVTRHTGNDHLHSPCQYVTCAVHKERQSLCPTYGNSDSAKDCLCLCHCLCGKSQGHTVTRSEENTGKRNMPHMNSLWVHGPWLLLIESQPLFAYSWCIVTECNRQ